MPELRATMTKDWENLFVNVKLVGKVMVAAASKHQNVVVILNVEIMLFVSMEFVPASKDSKEIFQTCKRFAQLNISMDNLLFLLSVVFLDHAVEQFALKMLNAS